ncbi:multicomponent Na+:H+ antiporter subunit C [Spinactinospora alkalitolerans]|uniref:Multicomponent Na+:H+ antiporter subunit C n=1 Tax=Spinactinospora alkalitolerans TaxID=687207 RepID=A0A852TWJ2_9ACTN|nr:NADH-quinone oxidoreductase subunit K [Spinactinospora alkalitolerans]NYE46444.1 multicomponent Na+:H+ antiporter subunit C [Spinactinospora alkalitolerans]
MTTPSFILIIAVGVLYSGGFYLLLQRALMRVVFGIVMLGHAANLSLILTDEAITVPPLLGGAAGEMSDPLPQAMALTAIVITFGVTTFLLALAYRVWLGDENDEVPDDVEDRRIMRLTEPEDSS